MSVIYNLTKLPNKTLERMLKVHKYLLVKSRQSDYVGHDELYQFYPAGSSDYAQILARAGIGYIDLHPIKRKQGQPKAIFFQDTERIEQAIKEIKLEIGLRKDRKRKSDPVSRLITVAPVRIKEHRTASQRETISNLDSMLKLFAPKRRGENVRSEGV